MCKTLPSLILVFPAPMHASPLPPPGVVTSILSAFSLPMLPTKRQVCNHAQNHDSFLNNLK